MRQVAGAMGWSESKVSRCERAQFVPSSDDVIRFVSAIGLPRDEQEPLIRLARDVGEPAWWESGVDLTTQTTALIDAEQRAVSIVQCATEVVPGLLQTREYARTVLSGSGEFSPARIKRLVDTRQYRQSVLSDDQQVNYTAYLSEAVLARVIGDPRIMASQLERIIRLANEPHTNITLRIIPFSTGVYPGLDGPFELIRFVREPPVVHIEHHHGGAVFNTEGDVGPFTHAADQLDQRAVEERESRKMISRYIARYKEGDQ